MQAKVEASAGSNKEDAEMRIQALRSKVTDLSKQLDSLKDANQSAWDNLKSGFLKGLTELRHVAIHETQNIQRCVRAL